MTYNDRPLPLPHWRTYEQGYEVGAKLGQHLKESHVEALLCNLMGGWFSTGVRAGIKAWDEAQVIEITF